MHLGTLIDTKISDIDARVQRIKDKAADEIAALLRSKAALVQAKGVLTPELEQAVHALQRIGLLDSLE